MSRPNKARFARSRRRAVNQIERFLLVSEGTETEPNYFQGFRAYVKPVIKTVGTGQNTVDVVRFAIKERDQVAGDEDKRFDQVWCLFDRDDFSDQRFLQAIKLAEANDIRLAYSIESFELWLLLHFSLITTEIGRAAYLQKLNAQFRKLGLGNYHKNDKAIYHKLLPFQPQALVNAEKLSNRYPDNLGVLQRDPETKVDRLVRELNKQGKARFN